MSLPGNAADIRVVTQRPNQDFFQPGIVDGAVGNACYATSRRLSFASFCRTIKRSETVNIDGRVFTDNTCPEAGGCIIAVSNHFTVFNPDISQSGSARKLTGNQTSLLAGIDFSPGNSHINNPAIAIKLLDKAVPEFINRVTTTIVLTNKRLGFAADRTGQVTGIDISMLAITTIERVGRIATDFIQHAAVIHLDPLPMIRNRRSTTPPQARSGTQPDSCFG